MAKGVPFEEAPQRFGGQLPQTAPLDPPLVKIIDFLINRSFNARFFVLFLELFSYLLQH